MKNSASFFQNRACEFFPCHAGANAEQFNCLFCYCPLFALGENCGGSFTYTENGIKDCSDCLFPHRPDSAAKIAERFPEIAELCKKPDTP